MSFLEDTDFAQIYSNRKALAVAHQHVQEPTVQVPQEQLEPQIKVNDEAAAKALRQQNEKLAEQARIAAIELEKRIKRKNALRKHIAANSPAVPNSFKVARKVAEQPTKPIVKKPERNAALAAEKEKERLERKKALEEGARERRRNQIALEEAQAAERAAAERAAAAAVDVNAPATVEAQSPAAPAPTLVTAPAPNVQPAAELVLATPITSFTAPAVVQVTPAVASVIPNQIPIASMNIASSAIPATARIVPLADLEYLLKTKWFPQKQNQPLNTVDEYAQVLLQMLRTSIADIFKMEASKALSRICARNSGELKDTTLAQIIEAMTEACSNGSAIVRAQVSTDLAVFNNLVVHENGGAGWTISPNADANIAELTVQIAAALAPVRPIITALLQRMGDSQREVYTAAVQSLAAYGIVTKNQLRAAMISCELLEASAPPLADASTVAATLLVAVGSVPSVTSGSVSSAADGSVSSVADGSVPSVALGSVSRVPVGSAPSAAVGSVRSIVTVRSVPSAAIASVPPVKSPLPGRSALPVAPAAPVAATDDSPVGIASQPKPTVRKNKMPTTVDPTPEPKLQTKPTKSQSAPVRRPVEFQLETLKAKSGNAIDEEMEDPRKLARPKTTPSKQQGKVMFRLAGGRMFPNYL